MNRIEMRKFEKSCSRPSDQDHWVWFGGRDPEGYGWLNCRDARRAYLAAYQHWVDPLGRVERLRPCELRLCVNPYHVEEREPNAYWICPNGHACSVVEVYVQPCGTKVCRICKRLSDKKYRKAHPKRRNSWRNKDPMWAPDYNTVVQETQEYEEFMRNLHKGWKF